MHPSAFCFSYEQIAVHIRNRLVKASHLVTQVQLILTVLYSLFSSTKQQRASVWTCLYMSPTVSFLKHTAKKGHLCICACIHRDEEGKWREWRTIARRPHSGLLFWLSGTIMTAQRAQVFQCGLFCRHCGKIKRNWFNNLSFLVCPIWCTLSSCLFEAFWNALYLGLFFVHMYNSICDKGRCHLICVLRHRSKCYCFRIAFIVSMYAGTTFTFGAREESNYNSLAPELSRPDHWLQIVIIKSPRPQMISHRC